MSAIFVVLPKLEEAKKIQRVLLNHGFDQVFAFQTAAMTLQEISEHKAGVVISAYRLSDMFYLDLKDNLPDNFELILMAQASTVATAASGILALSTPLKIGDLISTVDMVLRQVERRLKKNRKPAKRSEQEENYIRNAKYLLMDRNHLTEEEAFRYIQKCSMDNGINMVETAQMILTLMFEGDI